MISAVVLALSALLRPVSASCPRSWWVEGIEPSGVYRCVYTLGDDDSPPLGEYRGRVYCGMRTPLVIDSQHVGCR